MHYSIKIDEKIKLAFIEDSAGNTDCITFDTFKFHSYTGEGLQLLRIIPAGAAKNRTAQDIEDMVCFVPIHSIKMLQFVDLEKSTSEN